MVNPATDDHADPPLLPAALAAAARGWSVVPVEHGGKRPIVPWLPFQARRAGADELQRWFGTHRRLNLGVVTGAVSGLVVLDVDPRHGGDHSLATLEGLHGALPPTVEARTGGGGRHLYFAHPGGTVANRVGLAPGIDLRADGGMVVMPPSLHASGQRYAWEPGHAPDDRPLAPLPPWLLVLLRRGAPLHTRSSEEWRALLRDGVAEGERNASLASLAGHLLRHDVDPGEVLELLLAWNRQRCRPPLSDAEVAAVVHSIARRDAAAR